MLPSLIRPAVSKADEGKGGLLAAEADEYSDYHARNMINVPRRLSNQPSPVAASLRCDRLAFSISCPLSFLTTVLTDGINDNTIAATLIERSKTVLPDGAIVEIVIWKVPEPVAGSWHLFKYRLFYGKDGRRIVGFDNERGKGDHCHLDGDEQPYHFTTTDALLSDFRKEIIKRRQKP
ncbi:hypothetical protein RsS62_53600 [Rhizobium dioscoreae]|uniref:toxin-antitoxin system TumE family protein n=2 Tax=Rhizobium TaxID=379 RepID=UPI001272ED73|nr:hypothetical protein RsS62_53600 [Rhizobium dioscoreae]